MLSKLKAATLQISDYALIILKSSVAPFLEPIILRNFIRLILQTTSRLLHDDVVGIPSKTCFQGNYDAFQ